jgi:Transposase
LAVSLKVGDNKTGIGSLEDDFSFTNDTALTLPTFGGIKKVCELFLLFLRNIKSLLGFVQSGSQKLLQSLIAGMRRSGKRRSSKFDEEKLKEIITLHPDYYLSEIAVVFKATPSGVCRALKRYGITRKKRAFSSRNAMKASVKSFSPV